MLLKTKTKRKELVERRIVGCSTVVRVKVLAGLVIYRLSIEYLYRSGDSDVSWSSGGWAPSDQKSILKKIRFFPYAVAALPISFKPVPSAVVHASHCIASHSPLSHHSRGKSFPPSTKRNKTRRMTIYLLALSDPLYHAGAVD